MIGVVFVPPEGSGYDGSWLYTAITVIGVFECLTGLMGIAGACAHAKKGEAAKSNLNGAAAAKQVEAMASSDAGNEEAGEVVEQEPTEEELADEAQAIKSLRVFAGLLALILLMNLGVFAAAGSWAAEVDTMSDSEWLKINGTGGPLQSYCSQVGEPFETCVVSREQFEKDIMASFQLLMAAGITVIVYMMTGLGASVFVMYQEPGVLSHAEEMVAKHAKHYIDEVTAAELREKHGKESGVDKVETIKAVASTGSKKKKRVKRKKHPDETPEERAARIEKKKAEKKKQKQKQQEENGGEVAVDNPVSQPGEVFDMEDSTPTKGSRTENGNGMGEYEENESDADDSSEYEWHTTDTEDEDDFRDI